MRLSNCWLYAIHRWVTSGGFLILRRSWAGPYPHMMHAHMLPDDMWVTGGLFCALYRWVTRGGYLIISHSWYGPYPCLMHANTLHDDMWATHYSAEMPPRWWRWIFEGNIYYTVGQPNRRHGHRGSPPVKGKVDWVLLIFWVPYLLGWGWCLWWVIKLIIRTF